MLRLPTLAEMDRGGWPRILLYQKPADMRHGFDRLAELVRTHLQEDPLCASLFVFRSRCGGRLKILYWDRDGYALWYKRLEQGVFRFPKVAQDGAKVMLRPSELAMLLEGIDLRSVKRLPRFTAAAAA